MIHQYQNNGFRIVLDVYSGAVHVVDELCYDVIERLNEQNENHTVETLQKPDVMELLIHALGSKYPVEELRDALNDVTELTADGKLFAPDTYEPLIVAVKQRKTVVKALCLLMTVILPADIVLQRKESIMDGGRL